MTSALPASDDAAAASATEAVSSFDSLTFVAEDVASSAGAEVFTLDVSVSAAVAGPVDESVVLADEGDFLAGVDSAPAPD